MSYNPDAPQADIAHMLLEQVGVVAAPDDLAHLLGQCLLREYQDGQIICNEDDTGYEMWVLVKGEVHVQKRDFAGVARHLAILRAPALMGHMALIDGSHRSASCRADGHVITLVVDQMRFAALSKDPGPAGDIWRRLMLAHMSRQLRLGNEELKVLTDPAMALADAETEEMDAEAHHEREHAQALKAHATFDGWGG